MESVKYYDSDNVLQTLDSDDYDVDDVSEPARIRSVATTSFPSTYDRLNAVQVRFVSGYGSDASAIPNPLIQAIRLIIGHWYENRETVVIGTIANEIPFAAQALIDQFRIRTFPFEGYDE